MIFGMPTLIELDTLEDNAILCKELGLDFIEVNMNLPQFQIANMTEEKLIKIQNDYGVKFTFHIPEDLDIAHMNDKIRKVNHEIILDTIELMKKIGSTKLNMHMSRGIYFTMPSEKIYLYKKFSETYIKNIVEFRTKIDEAIGISDIQITIENTGIFNNNYLINAVDKLLESNAFSLTWDIGHDYSSGNKDLNFMKERTERIAHMHVHDAIADRNHLELYTGELDIDKFIEMIMKRRMTAVVETKTKFALENSVLSLFKRLKKIDVC